MLWASWISVPAAVGTSVAWWREASMSAITMSLSVARPMVAEPDGGSADLPGRWILRMLVAIFDRSPLVWRGAGPMSVGCALAGCGALDTAEVGGAPAGFWPTSKRSSGPARVPP